MASAHTISLADGMIAALAFSVLQGLMAIFSGPNIIDEHCRINHRRLHTRGPDCRRRLHYRSFGCWEPLASGKQIGLVPRDDQKPATLAPLQAYHEGAFWGAAAALGALGLSSGPESVPPMASVWKQDAELSSLSPSRRRPLWIWQHAADSCRSAVVEEFVFRGLIFGVCGEAQVRFWRSWGSCTVLFLRTFHDSDDTGLRFRHHAADRQPRLRDFYGPPS